MGYFGVVGVFGVLGEHHGSVFDHARTSGLPPILDSGTRQKRPICQNGAPQPPARMLPRQSSSALADATPWLACPPGDLPVANVVIACANTLLACANTLLAVASNLLAVGTILLAVANLLLAVATYFLFDYT